MPRPLRRRWIASLMLALSQTIFFGLASAAPLLQVWEPGDPTPRPSFSFQPPVAPVQPVVPVQPVPGQLRYGEAIAAFLRRLPPTRGETLSILQIGDSHTAGDMLTNGWRTLWQSEYGHAGRGAMVVGRPYQGYLSWGVTARQSPDWVANSLFGRQYNANGPLLGFSGFTQSASHAGAWLTLSADSSDFWFDRFSLCGLTGPDKGAVTVQLGSAVETVPFTAEQPGAACFDFASPSLLATLSLQTVDDRPVNLTSWETRRQAGGILLSNLGVVGSRAIHLTRNDDRVLGPELRHARPDLLVIAFGTNEGFDPTLDLDAARADLRAQIVRMRRLLGYSVPVLLLGPPDAASNRPAIALPSLPETVSCGDGWYVPGNIARMKRLQMQLAAEMGLAFWDWQQAMGGPCSSSRWVAQGLQRGDHVHFTKEGGYRLGAALAQDLDRVRAELARR